MTGYEGGDVGNRAPFCTECYSEPVMVSGTNWTGEPYALCIGCAEYYVVTV